MRISDWSSDVCSSDLEISRIVGKELKSSGLVMKTTVIRMRTDRVIDMASKRSSNQAGSGRMRTTRIAVTPSASAMSPRVSAVTMPAKRAPALPCKVALAILDRKSAAEGNSVSVRVDLGGCGIIKKKNKNKT